MSRSFKKTPYWGERKGKWKKRNANQSVRSQLKNVDWHPQRNSYKKMFERWDICDYCDICTFEEYYQSCLRSWYKWTHKFGEPKPVKNKELYREWYKQFKMK